jgi:hypothetical protein
MNMMYLAVAAGAYLVLKSRDSGNGKTATATNPAMAAKHPAFTYPPNQTMDRDTEVKLADALNAHAGINREGFRTVKRTVEELVALGVESPANPTHLQSWGFTEDEHQLILADFNAAIAYYPDRPHQILESIKLDLVQYKDQMVVVFPVDRVGMGPISGFSGVY